MSKKRGLSVDEKRSRLLDLFYEKKDFFQLKELEKIAPKEKGIVSQSVKDILQSLVDDNLVDTDKIGTSVYFWSFPSKQAASRKRKLSDIETKIENARKRKKCLEKEITEAKKGREETEEREEALKKLIDLKEQKEQLLQQIQKYKDCDPDIIDKLKKEIEVSKAGANRWTDNIFSLHSWISKNFPSINLADLNKQFGIPEDLDYVT